MATKITLKQLGDDILTLLKGGNGSASLEKDITSNTICGAAPSGTKFPMGTSFTEFAEKILRKDITPTISTSFSGVGTKEIGTSINGTTMTLKINNLSQVTVPINKIDFYIGNTLVNSQPYIEGKNTYSFVYSSTISSTVTAKAILTYSDSSTVQGTGTFNFVYGNFYGPTNVSTIDSTIANGLIPTLTKDIRGNKSFTWNNVILSDERFCYMYPSSYGPLSSIKDGNGFDQMNSYTQYQVNIIYPTNGKSIPYFVYLLTDSTTGTGFTQIYN